MIVFRRAVSREDAALIAQMDVICFPIDTPAEFARFIAQEQQRWKPVIARAGIKPD